jgi:hypothetical protein
MKPKVLKQKDFLSDWITPTKSKSTGKGYLLVIGSAAILLWISSWICDPIIAYPHLVAYGVFGITFIALAVFITIRGLPELGKAVNFWDSFFSNGFLLLIGIFVSVFITAALLIPFNYYLVHSAKSQPAKTNYYPIYDIITSSGKNRYPQVMFKLNGHVETLKGHRYIMSEMDTVPLKNFEIEIEGTPGLLGSFIVERWNIIKIAPAN